jgi:hypothetical protein
MILIVRFACARLDVGHPIEIFAEYGHDGSGMLADQLPMTSRLPTGADQKVGLGGGDRLSPGMLLAEEHAAGGSSLAWDLLKLSGSVDVCLM